MLTLDMFDWSVFFSFDVIMDDHRTINVTMIHELVWDAHILYVDLQLRKCNMIRIFGAHRERSYHNIKHDFGPCKIKKLLARPSVICIYHGACVSSLHFSLSKKWINN